MIYTCIDFPRALVLHDYERSIDEIFVCCGRSRIVFTRNAQCVLRVIRLFTLLLLAAFLLQTIAGCGTAPSSDKGSASSTQGPSIYGPVLPPGYKPSPTPALKPTPTLQATQLHGPANFLLNNTLNFSSASGTTTDNSGSTTQLDAKTVEAGITNEFKHILFVANSDDVVKVYVPGAPAATSTEVSQRSDGSTGIDYAQQEGNVTTTFGSALYKDQIIVQYEQKYSGQATSDDPLASTGSDATVEFTTTVHWVAPKEIPTSPGDGTFQVASDGSVHLSWSAGQNATGYDIYRLIPGVDQQYQLLATVQNTSYSDTSSGAVKNVKTATGIAYAVFAVGATGVENPSDVVINAVSK